MRPVLRWIVPARRGAVGTARSSASRDAAQWVDIDTASVPLSTHDSTAGDWGRLAVAALVWIALPMAVGWFRLLHRELKSA